MDTLHTRAYQRSLAAYYSERSGDYDASEWHTHIAQRLVDRSDLRAGAKVLDVCTGTGMVALYAATKVGPEGSVLGIDISSGMLDLARIKAVTAGATQVGFALADAEHIHTPDEPYDNLYCGSAFILMTDLLGALRHWRSLLKPGGQLGFQAFSDHSFISGVLARTILAQYGAELLLNSPTGSVERCRALLTQSGYTDIHIEIEEFSRYITLEEARSAWMDGSRPAPGQFPHPIESLTAEQRRAAQAQYVRALEERLTPLGIVDDMTAYYVYARR